jgi:tripartite-type tricarboxylate transporter receptor subunit TctC
MPHSKTLKAAVLIALLAAWLPALSQEKFPSRPIEIIVPTPPGGGTDAVARQLGDLVEPILGQKVIVSNRPGGGGMIGMAAVTQARPDGYTLGGLWPGPITMTPHMQAAPYTPEDYTTIVLADISPGILCVKPEMAAANARELIELIRKNPNKFTYGNDGVGGMMHLSTERIFSRLGLKARAVPFGGAGETLKNFLGGHVDIYSGSITPILPYVKAGTAKCVLLTSKEKSDIVPLASSLAELGIPESAMNMWHGIVGPKGIPAERLAILQRAFTQAAKSDKFRELAVASGAIPVAQDGAQFRKHIDGESVAMHELMKSLGLAK